MAMLMAASFGSQFALVACRHPFLSWQLFICGDHQQNSSDWLRVLRVHCRTHVRSTRSEIASRCIPARCKYFAVLSGECLDIYTTLAGNGPQDQERRAVPSTQRDWTLSVWMPCGAGTPGGRLLGAACLIHRPTKRLKPPRLELGAK
jgi:hypothetical protein